MDLITIALVFLILLLSVFLTITGIQVFFILRDLKKALDRFNNMLKSGENIASDIEKPAGAAIKVLKEVIKKDSKLKQKRFYKKVL